MYKSVTNNNNNNGEVVEQAQIERRPTKPVDSLVTSSGFSFYSISCEIGLGVPYDWGECAEHTYST